ncbi:hypothetical protein DFH07DRAFT_51357 [Mycena maculata]|uniref:Uncharacterized protein n=1 Tax=Mycena maculata TaxID=230809 RepID=A0AAD7IF85_9AGAR|nr:hypothetical protein DFH07DRAFT_51357 [Mycena maculata]
MLFSVTSSREFLWHSDQRSGMCPFSRNWQPLPRILISVPAFRLCSYRVLTRSRPSRRLQNRRGNVKRPLRDGLSSPAPLLVLRISTRKCGVRQAEPRFENRARLFRDDSSHSRGPAPSHRHTSFNRARVGSTNASGESLSVHARGSFQPAERFNSSIFLIFWVVCAPPHSYSAPCSRRSTPGTEKTRRQLESLIPNSGHARTPCSQDVLVDLILICASASRERYIPTSTFT